MKCPRCDNEIPNRASLCHKCGYDFRENTKALEKDDTGKAKSFVDTEKVKGNRLLLVVGGHDIGEEIDLIDGTYVIGRDPGSNIFLNDITVSRRHCELILSPTKAALRDMGSLNGTYVNGNRIEEIELKSGDEVQIGKFKLLYIHKRGEN